MIDSFHLTNFKVPTWLLMPSIEAVTQEAQDRIHWPRSSPWEIRVDFELPVPDGFQAVASW